MNPIAILFGLVLLAISVFFVVSPFRSPMKQKPSAGRGITQKDHMMLSPENQRQAVLLALRDLDFDYQAGKVAEEDYPVLRANLLMEVAQLMQIQERQKEDSIEALIRARRQARSATQLVEQEHPLAQSKGNGTPKNLCQHCQAPLLAGAKFCSKCGTPVGEITCPKCKHTLHPGDRFCPSCGTDMQPEKQSIETAASKPAASMVQARLKGK